MIINKYIQRPYHTPVIKITSDSHEVIQSLCLQYGEYINDDKTDNFFEIIVFMSHEDKAVPKYVLRYDNRAMPNVIYTDNPLQEIDNIIFSKTQYDQKVFALHAAAVKYNHKVHVLIAPTKTGKTTLTSFLSSSGFDYVTDDLVLLLMDNLYVHPYTTPIQLRGGGLDVLRTCNIFPENLIPLDIPNNKRYVYMPENCMKEPLPLGNIYFIGRSETENIAAVLSVTKAVAELMKSPITSYPVTSEYLRFLSRLAFLRSIGLNDNKIELIVECIRSHRYRSRFQPESIEAKILFDADKLDSIGAIGVARSFAWIGEHRGKIYNHPHLLSDSILEKMDEENSSEKKIQCIKNAYDN